MDQCQHDAYVGQMPFKLEKKMNPFCHDIYVNHCSSTLWMNVRNVKQLSYKFWKHYWYYIAIIYDEKWTIIQQINYYIMIAIINLKSIFGIF